MTDDTGWRSCSARRAADPRRRPPGSTTGSCCPRPADHRAAPVGVVAGAFALSRWSGWGRRWRAGLADRDLGRRAGRRGTGRSERVEAAPAPCTGGGRTGGQAGAERAAAPEAADAAGAPHRPRSPPPSPVPRWARPGDGADRQDPQLRAYLEQVLPEVIGARPRPARPCLPGTQRYVTVEVGTAVRGCRTCRRHGARPAPGCGQRTHRIGRDGDRHTGPTDAGVPPPSWTARRDRQFLAPRL